MLEIDSKAVCHALLGGNCQVLSAANLLFKCKKLLSRGWEVSVLHVCREANRIADYLASLSLQQDYGFKVFEVSPHYAQTLITEDLLGYSYPRAVYV